MIPYQIDGFEAKYMSLSDPEGPDNAMDIRVKFRLDVNGKEHPIQVRAKLVMSAGAKIGHRAPRERGFAAD